MYIMPCSIFMHPFISPETFLNSFFKIVHDSTGKIFIVDKVSPIFTTHRASTFARVVELIKQQNICEFTLKTLENLFPPNEEIYITYCETILNTPHAYEEIHCKLYDSYGDYIGYCEMKYTYQYVVFVINYMTNDVVWENRFNSRRNSWWKEYITKEQTSVFHNQHALMEFTQIDPKKIDARVQCSVLPRKLSNDNAFDT